MKKFINIDILKKLVFPALMVLLIPSCTVFPYRGREAQPSIKERIQFIGNLPLSREDPNSLDSFNRDVTKVLEIRNPLNFKIKVLFSCTDEEELQTAILPPHTWTSYLYSTKAKYMYDHPCFVDSWTVVQGDR